jgi:ankyrin repeat protein
MWTAAESGNVREVSRLIEQGVDIDKRGGFHRSTPMHIALMRGHMAVATLLFRCGAELNVFNDNGETPLHSAVVCRDIPPSWGAHNVACGVRMFVEEMVEWGASVSAAVRWGTAHGSTPLHYCMWNQDIAMLRVLLRIGADVHATDRNGWDAMRIAEHVGWGGAVAVLVLHGAVICSPHKSCSGSRDESLSPRDGSDESMYWGYRTAPGALWQPTRPTRR